MNDGQMNGCMHAWIYYGWKNEEMDDGMIVDRSLDDRLIE